MTFDVLVWEITATYSGSWDGDGGPHDLTVGKYLHVILDDATNSLTVKVSSQLAEGGGSELYEGPNLFFGFGGAAVLRTIAPFHQYCVGTTLYKVGTTNGFPYGLLAVNQNNSECQIAPTCDLEISNDYAITPTTGPSNADGAFVGSATSSNGTIKYSFNPDFNYGENFPGNPLDVISDWESFNTSSEPMVWATGATPTLTVTHPTNLTPAKSDWFGPAYGSNPVVEGVTYKYAFQFTLYSDVTDYVFIYIVIGDVFFNVLKSKAVAGYGTPGGTVINGTWEVIAPAEVGGQPLRLAVYAQYAAGSHYDGSVEINSFVDASATTADPGVQTELNYPGLLPGTYTVYAKDGAGCQDSITFEIPITTEYGIRYRLDFTDEIARSGKAIRLDIYQRSYEGDIEEIKSGKTPILVRYEGDRDDPNVALVASNVTIELLVEVSGQFNDMFLSDDRKYRPQIYVGDDFSSLELYWIGFIVPEFHSEPYIFEPYPLTITASDGLGEMKAHDFVDLNENPIRGDMKVIKILSEIFKKTGLELSIRSGINVFDSGMDTDAEDDPLDQAYIDTRIYYNVKKTPDKCDSVLRSIADPFRGQIFQSMGKWWIIRLSDAVGTFNYREFDFEGDYSSNGSFNPVKELDFPSAIHPDGKLMFANKTQLLTFVRNYGYFSITHDLKKDGNLIDTGLFEAEDIIQLASGNYTFKDWGVLVGQPGVKYGHETVVNGDSTGAFYFDFNSAQGDQVDTVLYSTQIPVESNGQIRFKFQYFVSPQYNVPYIRLAWTIKAHNSVDDSFTWIAYDGNGRITNYNIEQKNEVYVSSYNSWQTVDVLAHIPGVNVDYFEIAFYFHDHHGRDFEDIPALQDFDPTNLSNPDGMRRMVKGPSNETYVYTLEYSTDAEDLPNVVHPDTFASHSLLWRLDKVINLGSETHLIDRIKFDNVSVAFYPLVFHPTTQNIDPQETIDYSEEVDEFVSSDFTKTVSLGDLIRFDEEAPRNEKYLYRGYFRLADGTPTRNWNRTGVTEAKALLRILLEDYIAQFSLPQKKLSGLKISENTVLHFVNCLRNTDGVRYRPMTFEFNMKKAMYTPDMSGVIAGEDGEPPYAPGEFAELEFSDDFNTGE